MDTEQRATQDKFGVLVGISRQAVSSLLARGHLPQDGTFGDWLLAYCERLRNAAAGRGTSGDGESLDLVQERAALARSQREAQDLKNAIARGEYAPIEVITATLANAAKVVADALDVLPMRIKARNPDLPPEALQLIVETMAQARNDMADSVAELADGSEDESAA